jgi:endonuclease/exonuclease/phosphatase family metal-dependent hydrolase
MALRLASYNVHSAVGRDGRCEPKRILDVIHEIDADVVALQEVEAHDSGGDMLAWLAGQTGMRAIAGTTLRRHDGYFGNGLLTRREIKAIRLVDLSFRNREPRGAIDIDLACDSGASVHVVATHLGLRPGERRQQVERLLELFDWHEKRPRC